jgi:hypothetical protein
MMHTLLVRPRKLCVRCLHLESRYIDAFMRTLILLSFLAAATVVSAEQVLPEQSFMMYNLWCHTVNSAELPLFHLIQTEATTVSVL